MIKAQLADGTVLEFPDGTDPAVIQNTVKNLIREQNRQPNPEIMALGQEQPGMTLGEAAQGTVGALGQMAMRGITEPFIGLMGAGAALATGDPANAGGFVNYLNEQLPQPGENTQRVLENISQFIPEVGPRLGEAAFESTGMPSVAAVAETLPTAVLEVLGLKAPRLVAKLASRKGNLTAQEADIIRREVDSLRSGRASTEGVQATAEAITRADQADIASLAQFDERILKAANDLGIDEVPPSVAAGNAQFRDLAQGLASLPATPAKAQYGAFLERLGNTADQLIVEGGGSLDKPSLSQRFRETTSRTIDQMKEAEGLIYDEIRGKIGRSTQFDPTNARAFIDNAVVEFGSIADMPKVYKDLHRMLYEKVDGEFVPRNPTYAAFDQKRREIGASLGRKPGPYSDSETGTLKGAYSALKEDQTSLARDFGFDELQASADAWTIKRKALEDTTVELMGRDLSKDLMPTVSAKIKGLPKGDVTKFKQTIDAIPEGMRQEVVVSALNDIMKGTGADQAGLGAARFVGFMNELNRSPTAKNTLYGYLPKKTQQALDNLYTLANGVYKANKENITTGKISTFFPDTRGFMRQMIGKTVTGVAASKAGLVGAEAANAVLEFMNNSTPKSVAANNLISSSEFQTMMKNAVRDGVLEGNTISSKTKRLEELVSKSDRFKKWADRLDGNSKADLASLGLINYLMAADQEQ